MKKIITSLFFGVFSCCVFAADNPNSINSSQNQLIIDTEAEVLSNWHELGSLISSIETGYKCDVIDQTSALMAVRTIEADMQEELNGSGLAGDLNPRLNVQIVVSTAIQSGKKSFNNGACRNMTPEYRGKLRGIVSGIIQ